MSSIRHSIRYLGNKTRNAKENIKDKLRKTMKNLRCAVSNKGPKIFDSILSEYNNIKSLFYTVNKDKTYVLTGDIKYIKDNCEYFGILKLNMNVYHIAINLKKDIKHLIHSKDNKINQTICIDKSTETKLNEIDKKLNVMIKLMKDCNIQLDRSLRKNYMEQSNKRNIQQKCREYLQEWLNKIHDENTFKTEITEDFEDIKDCGKYLSILKDMVMNLIDDYNKNLKIRLKIKNLEIPKDKFNLNKLVELKNLGTNDIFGITIRQVEGKTESASLDDNHFNEKSETHANYDTPSYGTPSDGTPSDPDQIDVTFSETYKNQSSHISEHNPSFISSTTRRNGGKLNKVKTHKIKKNRKLHKRR